MRCQVFHISSKFKPFLFQLFCVECGGVVQVGFEVKPSKEPVTAILQYDIEKELTSHYYEKHGSVRSN